MRKVLKILLIVLAIPIVIAIIGIIVLKIANSNFIGRADKTAVEYLQKNQLVFNERSEKDNSFSKFFNPDFYNSKVILLGESHGYADVQDIDKSLLIHLNKTKGVRYYIAEMDSTTANKFNAFLSGETKDTLLLKEAVKGVKQRIPQQAGNELYTKWSEIYDYNNTITDSMRISIIGIDKSLNDTSKISRDSCMYANFCNIIEQKNLTNESFYGLFGLFHILQTGMNRDNFKTFGARLKYRGIHVESIICLDIDSEVYLPEGTFPVSPNDEKTKLLSMNGPLFIFKGIRNFEKASKRNSITFFDLKGDGTPFVNKEFKIHSKSFIFNQDIAPYSDDVPASDIVQYVILLRNVKAMSPLK